MLGNMKGQGLEWWIRGPNKGGHAPKLIPKLPPYIFAIGWIDKIRN